MTQQPWGGPNQWGPTQTQWPPQYAQQYPPPQQFQQPQYPQQYQWPAPQQGGYGRPPRRKGPGFFGLLLRVAFIIVVIMIGLAILRGIGTILNSAGTRLPTGTSTTDTSGGTAPDDGSGTTQYQNEGYQAPPADFDPPALPQPATYSEARDWLNKNVVYGDTVPAPTNCKMTAIEEGLSKAQLETRLNQQVECLMAVWAPPLEAAGFDLPRPPVTVYNSPVTTACGVMKEVNAAYCAGDQHIYYALPLLQALPAQVSNTKYAAEEVIAHEFGHTVQARTGILVSDKALEQRASDAEALVLSRRAEQQADCFGGLYIGSVAQSQGLGNKDLQKLVDMTYYLGDDALGAAPGEGDHGTGRNRQIWFAKGLQTTQIGVCNTWVVPASQVK